MSRTRHPRIFTWCVAAAASFVLAALTATATPSVASAQVVGIEVFEGPKEGKVRGQVVKALKKRRIKVVRAKTIKNTASELGADIQDFDDRADIARKHGITAWVFAIIEKEGRSWTCTVAVTNASNGELIGEAVFKNRRFNGLVRVVGKGFWKKLGKAIKSGSAPADKEAAVAAVGDGDGQTDDVSNDDDDEGDDDDDDDDDDDSGPSVSGSRPLDIGAGVMFFTRSFTYNDDLFQALRPYDLGVAPGVTIHLDWYPGAHVTDGVAADIGLTGSFNMGLGLTSETSDGGEFPTSSMGFDVGLKYRIPFSDSEVSLALLYGHYEFTIEDGDTPKPLIPSVAYDWVGPELAARIAVVDPIAIYVGGRYQLVLGTGEISEDVFFPNATAGGVGAHFALAYGITDSLDARLGVDFARYFFTLDPEPDASLVAGGAVDQYITSSLTVSYVME